MLSNRAVLFCLVVVMLTISMVHAFAGVNRKVCQTSSDCDAEQCCADTPMGTQLCLAYEKEGDLCLFRYRTPSCGCAEGLRCVSTTPMEPGVWSHDYVCARVGPFNYFKLMPYLDNSNQV